MRILLIVVLLTIFAAAGCDSPNNNSSNMGASSSSQADSGTSNSDSDDAENAELMSNESDPAPSKSGIESVYTDLAENKCRDVDINEDEGWSVQSCGGVAGYDLIVSEGDLRQTINIVAPGGKKYELNYWTVVSGGFSTVGDKAEWRVKKADGKLIPIALIVRYNVSENPENSDEVTSYLTVSKITSDQACVTDVVKPVEDANTKARELADVSGQKPCMKRRGSKGL